jgi:hypothetical protein
MATRMPGYSKPKALNLELLKVLNGTTFLDKRMPYKPAPDMLRDNARFKHALTLSFIYIFPPKGVEWDTLSG